MVNTNAAPATAGTRSETVFQPGTCASAACHFASRSLTDVMGAASTRGAAVGADAAAARAGGASPATRYARSLAHGYEMTVADATTIASGTADQSPSALCQL